MTAYPAVFKLITSIVLLSFIAGCGDQGGETPVQSLAPHTDNTTLEEMDRNPEAFFMEVKPGKTYYIHVTSKLNARSAPVIADNIVGQLFTNDEVEIVGDDGDEFLEVRVLKTAGNLTVGDEVYVSRMYVSETPMKVTVSGDQARYSRNEVFIIQNVATEIMRVYLRKCNDGQCAHEMILETDIAVGENKPDTMTILGHFNIDRWVKFYQDGNRSYPSWYDPTYPPVPKPGANVVAWTKKGVLPNGKGSVRGAFGWYAALVGPDARAQWTHGTLGWGADGTKYIDATRKLLANIFTDPRSHGCTRTDNESIAYIRSLVPKGTPIIKIYAKEGYLDASRSRYSKDKKYWSYIMTKNGVRVDGEIADRETVLRNNTPRDQWLEEGIYAYDAHPDAKAFKNRGRPKRGKNGNVYDIDESEFQGAFLVDAGLLVNYKHPARFDRIKGGYKDVVLPPYVISNARYVLP